MIKRSPLIECNIKECKTKDEIESTFQVMRQLRQNIKVEDYLNRIYALIEKEQYRLFGAFNSKNQCI